MEKFNFTATPEEDKSSTGAPETFEIKEEDARELAKNRLSEFFADSPLLDKQGIRKIEKEKTKEDLEMINLANIYTNQIRSKYGLDDLNIDSEKIHIVSADKWPEEFKGDGNFDWAGHEVALKENESMMATFENLVHEMVHAKSHVSVDMDMPEELGLDRTGKITLPSPEAASIGLSRMVFGEKGIAHSFNNINEAVTQILTEDVFMKGFSHPIFQAEVEASGEAAQKMADNYGMNIEDLLSDKIIFPKTGGGAMVYEKNAHSYPTQINALKIVVGKLFEKNKDRFKSKTEIFDIFAEAMFSGGTEDLQKLVDDSFGSGTFEHLGKLDGEPMPLWEFARGLQI